jgi:hypothetical protein
MALSPRAFHGAFGAGMRGGEARVIPYGQGRVGRLSATREASGDFELWEGVPDLNLTRGRWGAGVLRLYDWLSTGKDLIDNMWFATSVLRGAPAIGFFLGYWSSEIAGALVLGSVVLAGVLLVVVLAAAIANQRLPLTIRSTLVEHEHNGDVKPGTLYASGFDDAAGSITGGSFSAQLTADVKGDEDVQITDLRVELSKLLLGAFRVRLGTLEYDEVAGQPAGNTGWLVRAESDPQTARANFYGDLTQPNTIWKILPNDEIRARVVVELGSPRLKAYAQVPGLIEVRSMIRPQVVSGRTPGREN